MNIQQREQLLCSTIKVHDRSVYYGNTNVFPVVALQMVYEQMENCKYDISFECLRKLQILADKITQCYPDICHIRGPKVFLQEREDVLKYLVNIEINLTTKDNAIYFGNGDDVLTFDESYFAQESFEASLIQIVTLPATGVLKYNDELITPGFLFDISDADKLTYTREDNPYQDTFIFKVSNNETEKTFSNMATFTVNVDGQINQPATIGDGSETTAYSSTIVFTRAMFTTATTPPYSDPEGDAAASLKITSLPATGEIQYEGSPILVNDIFDFTTDIDAGKLTYVPDAGTTSSYVDPFTFEIADAGSGTFVP